MTSPEPSQMRVSDEDRHKVAEVLREAAGAGRLDLDELDQRLEATYAARVYGDLVPLTVDLPGAPSVVPVHLAGSVPVAAPAVSGARVGAVEPHVSSLAIMSECARRGVWEVPQEHSATSVMGSVTLDLREARLTAARTEIKAYAVMGEVVVIVNAGTRVVVDGTGVMGEFSQAKDKVADASGPDSPVVHVSGFALMGSVLVKRKRMPGEPSPLAKKLLG